MSIFRRGRVRRSDGSGFARRTFVPAQGTAATRFTNTLGLVTMLHVLDWTLFLLHAALVGFNMVGWAWRRTRVFHLVTLGLTAFSWFVIGAFWGWGYCVCTDWHSQIRRQLGYVDPEATFVQQLAVGFFGISLGRGLADGIAGGVFVLIVMATAIVWAKDLLRKKG
jgi:hypothetical protein